MGKIVGTPLLMKENEPNKKYLAQKSEVRALLMDSTFWVKTRRCWQTEVMQSLLIVFSGRVNGRSYRADLELHQNILADVCCWEMMSNEPVLKLVKRQQGYWERLVRTKVLKSWYFIHMLTRTHKWIGTWWIWTISFHRIFLWVTTWSTLMKM